MQNTQNETLEQPTPEAKPEIGATTPENPAPKVKAPSEPVQFNAFVIGLAVAVVVSSLISILGVRIMANRNMLGMPESNVVTLDTGRLVAAHANAMRAIAQNTDEMATMNQRFLDRFQKSLEAYKRQGVMIIQSDATVVSPSDVTADFLAALIPDAPTAPAQPQASTPAANAPVAQ